MSPRAGSNHELRERARSLYEDGRWQACIDIVLGLAARGDVDPQDPLLMASAYEELGNAEAARLCREHGPAMLASIQRDCRISI